MYMVLHGAVWCCIVLYGIVLYNVVWCLGEYAIYN